MPKIETCPWCGQEMEEGTLRSKGGNYFLPINENMPWTYSAKSMAKKNAVSLPPDILDDPLTWPAAFICRNCKKIIIPY